MNRIPQFWLISLCWLAFSVSAQSPAPPVRVKGRALLVGVNQYANPKYNLRGAVEDVLAMKAFIKQKYGFAEEEIHTLLNEQATRQNILAEFRHWLIAGTQAGERVFFHYSGHGYHMPDDNGDEDDGEDETLAPYDVTERLENQIRDDEINTLIAQLSGRLAVLLFDSCHSGTVSRDLGVSNVNGAQARLLPNIAALDTANARGASTADDRVLAKRDLKLVNIKQAGAASGVLVLSAAQATQRAYSIKTLQGGMRGALSLYFVELQQGRELTFRQLKQELTQRFNELLRDQKIPAAQIPFGEIIDSAPLEDLPLFTGPQAQLALPITLLANHASAMQITLRTAEHRTSYRFGQKVNYEITTSAPGYLYVLVFSQGELASCVFPNRYDGNNYISAGTHRFPRKSEGIEIGAPAGKDVVVALLTNTKLDLGEKEEYTWHEVFARLPSPQLSAHVKSRGQKVTPPTRASDWQAASLVLETVP